MSNDLMVVPDFHVNEMLYVRNVQLKIKIERISTRPIYFVDINTRTLRNNVSAFYSRFIFSDRDFDVLTRLQNISKELALTEHAQISNYINDRLKTTKLASFDDMRSELAIEINYTPLPESLLNYLKAKLPKTDDHKKFLKSFSQLFEDVGSGKMKYNEALAAKARFLANLNIPGDAFVKLPLGKTIERKEW